MNEIELFKSENNKNLNQTPKNKQQAQSSEQLKQKLGIQSQKKNSSIQRLQTNRPNNIQVSRSMPMNQKWCECKIIGKNVSVRSYSAACIFKEKMYVYGGYQILNGSLSDFYKISLQDNEATFNWSEIHSNEEINPGKRCKHALIATNKYIYLIGGLQNDMHDSRDILQYSDQNENWIKLKPKNIQALPPLQSFGSVLIKNQKIILCCGFCDEKMETTNAIYQYNIDNDQIVILYENNNDWGKQVPRPRSGIALTCNENQIYMHGGKDSDQRLKDLWKFNLKTMKYSLLPNEGQVPVERNGHTINYYNNKLYVFGGIRDITWQLDDLHIYDLQKQVWSTLQKDSPRKIDKKIPQKPEKMEQNNKKNKKNWYESQHNNLSIKHNTTNTLSPNRTPNYQLSYALQKQQGKNVSPGKMIDQQRKKVFLQKKNEMLKNFQINQLDKAKYIELETSSQTMKNSLDVIGNPTNKSKNQQRLTQFGKQSSSKFLAPLENNANLINGKKPCARDGHCSVLMADQLIFFGGDRHQMSFNDIYKLNLAAIDSNINK